MYAITVALFSMNLSRSRTAPMPVDDEERRMVGRRQSDQHPSVAPEQSGNPRPPAVAEPLRVNTLPRDFEPKPQTQEHYLNPEDAANAGIEPPTPVLKAQMAGKGQLLSEPLPMPARTSPSESATEKEHTKEEATFGVTKCESYSSHEVIASQRLE